MSNIKCNGKITTNEIEIEESFTALTNIGGGISVSDPVNVGIDLGRRDGTPGSPHINFFTNGTSNNECNAKIMAENNTLNLMATGGLKINDVEMKDYVIYSEINENKWCRIWKSGMLENGGYSTKRISDYNCQNFMFLKPYETCNYSYSLGTCYTNDDGAWNGAYMVMYHSSTDIDIYSRGSKDGGRYVSWYTCGKVDPDVKIEGEQNE